MPLTRSVAESRLERDNLGLLAELSVVVTPGTDQLLGSVLADALARLGVLVADPEAPSDGELMLVPALRIPYFQALADVLLKESLLGTALAYTSEQDGQNRKEFSDMARSLEALVARRWKVVRSLSGSAGEFVAGIIAPRPQPPDAIRLPSWETRV